MRTWWLWVSFGVLVSLGYPLLPSGGVASTVAYNGLGVLSFLVIIAGVRRNRPADSGAWYLFAAGVITFVAADIVYEVTGRILGEHPYPYWDDALYFLAYPMLWIGLLRTGRNRGRARGPQDLAGAIDAAVIAAGVGLVYWVFVIQPTLDRKSVV